jgi:putative PIN family toxin of toxin-antitoxin system
MTRLVLDTNVLVSALLNPRGAPAQVLRLVLAGEIGLCVDERILQEYYDVLTRPRFGFPVSDVNDLLAFLHEGSEVFTAVPARTISPDPYDQVFVEVALASGVSHLITGNPRHFRGLEKFGVRVVSPKQFLEKGDTYFS